MTRTALVVGINTYTHFKPLKAPAVDAEDIAQRLEQDGEFRVTRLPEAISQNSGQNIPTVGKTLAISQTQLEAALKQLFLPKSHQAPKTALFYFSGHGLRDEEGDEGLDKGYLVTSDTDPHKSRPGLSLAWLQNLLKRSQIQQQIVWLDCCHSGSFLEAANPGQSPNRDRCFIASSRSFEESWQDLNRPYSVLTKALLDGLNPKIHVVSGDWIDTFALTTYVKQSLRKEQQAPVCTNFGTPIPLIRVDSESGIFPGVNDDAICPYKGLEYFEFNDEDPKYFFGREQLIDELLDQVRMEKFVALIGASGSGKSSVLFAGLLHQLSLGQRVVGSDQWQIYVTRPDQHPLQSLALAFVEDGLSDLEKVKALGHARDLISKGASGLRRLVQESPAPRVILVIDQFEEVFTRCVDLEEREQFFTCIMGALDDTNDKLRVIIAMRADFVGKCLEREYSGLAQQVALGTVNVLPMDESELRAAICKPAAKAGLAVDDALVTQILADIDGEPGSLPLLQYTLKTLWQECKGNRLLFSTYRSLGGINGTLDKRATEIYRGFDPAQQRTVQHIFQQLTQLGEGTADTRRRVFLDNLISEPQHPAEQVKQVIEILANRENRLLVSNEVMSKDVASGRRPVVDVAHEALIRHWRLLRQWIEQDRDLLRQQRRIETNVATWQEHNQAKGYLLQGFLLKEALRFQQQQARTLPLSDSAQNFLKQSLWQRRWDQLKMASLAVLLIPTVVDYALHRQKVEQYYTKLNGIDQVAERESILFLTQHCLQRQGELTGYIIERTTNQYCRSLANRTFTNGIDLSGVNLLYTTLSDADLSDATLNGANLNIADLSKSDLRRANLRHATLNGADLSDATFSEAILSGATLNGADLTNATLSEADLRSADLSDANLSDATLSGVDFFGANLFSATLSNATLIHATLTNAYLSQANLSGADLRSANLWGADLSDATLRSADLLKANLTTANLSGANLDKANFSGADLSHAYLSGSFATSSRSATLRSTNLSEANLYSATLAGANLSDADISHATLVEADLSKADLSSTDFSGAFLAATDLRYAKKLTSDQLTGEDQPYLCNIALPNYITGIDPNRDCSRLPQAIVNRYGLTNNYAEQLVQSIRAYQFRVLD